LSLLQPAAQDSQFCPSNMQSRENIPQYDFFEGFISE
jgi:hypothetical protein